MPSDTDFNDDLNAVNSRIAHHEDRLKLVRSEYLDDIAQANLFLRALAASQSVEEAKERVKNVPGFVEVTAQAAAATMLTNAPMPTPPVAVKSTPATPGLTGYQRLAQAFTGSQPITSQSQPNTPVLGVAQGVTRLAAYYARQAKSSSPA